jgi:endonuclease/exonuclease/phosphatase family metal-dependent hydrolase
MLRAKILIFVLMLFISSAHAYDDSHYTSPTSLPLTKEDLLNLYSDQPSVQLLTKLRTTLNHIQVSELEAHKKHGLSFNTAFEKKFFRVTHWNMERGYSLDLLDQAFNHTEEFFINSVFEDFKEGKNNKAKLKIQEELQVLKDTDIFTLNEADYGIQRTNYRNVTKDFANLVGASYYAFIPEFIELSEVLIEDPDLDIEKYKGLHGNAIVSKFPIVATRFFRLPRCYDWHLQEREKLVLMERVRRQASKVLIKEQVYTEVRHGDRVALIADIKLPEDQGLVTVVSVHLENRCLPKCREEQMRTLLRQLRHIKNPVIIGGDFNNFESSAEPTSFTKIVGRTVSDPQNLARATMTYFNPYSIVVNPGLFMVNTTRKYKDPTTQGIPVLLRNKAKKLFDILHDFRFDDGIDLILLVIAS